MDGDEDDVVLAEPAAPLVHAAAALGQGDVPFLRDKEFGVEAEGGETGHNTACNFTVVRPFKETAVRGVLSCSFLNR